MKNRMKTKKSEEKKIPRKRERESGGKERKRGKWSEMKR